MTPAPRLDASPRTCYIPSTCVADLTTTGGVPRPGRGSRGPAAVVVRYADRSLSYGV